MGSGCGEVAGFSCAWRKGVEKTWIRPIRHKRKDRGDSFNRIMVEAPIEAFRALGALRDLSQSFQPVDFFTVFQPGFADIRRQDILDLDVGFCLYRFDIPDQFPSIRRFPADLSREAVEFIKDQLSPAENIAVSLIKGKQVDVGKTFVLFLHFDFITVDQGFGVGKKEGRFKLVNGFGVGNLPEFGLVVMFLFPGQISVKDIRFLIGSVQGAL